MNTEDKSPAIAKVYTGSRVRERGALVAVNGSELALRLDLMNHSPTGFEWGYSGSGPAQLALALLADLLGSDDEALELYQDFKARVIAGIKTSEWMITDTQALAEVAAIRRERESA